jgi:hypothetical protein
VSLLDAAGVRTLGKRRGGERSPLRSSPITFGGTNIVAEPSHRYPQKEASMVRSVGVTMIALCCAVQAVAQSSASGEPSRYLLFGGYSANADFVPNRAALLVTDRKVAPFFSHGSGPTGFEVSVTRIRSRHVAFAVDLSGYSDRFSGGATFCQFPTGCAPGLKHEANTRAVYLVAGPEVRADEWRRLTPFVHGLIGAVFTSSKFTMSGTNLQYFNPYGGSGLVVVSTSASTPGSSVRYSDSSSDAGLTLTLGAGLDVRFSKAFSARALMDYAPTFLERPDLRNANSAEALGTVNRQAHARFSFGIVWKFR